MDFQTPSKELLNRKALELAEQVIYDWKVLDDPTKDWYIRSIIELWKQNPEVMRTVFRGQIS